MAWESNYTGDYRDLLFRMKEILTGEPLITPVIRSGVGDGIVHSLHTTDAGSTRQVWTLTCTNNLPPATFSVSGSVTGAGPDATVGVPYDDGDIKFTIADGSQSFIAGDNFVFTVYDNPLVAAAATWVMERWIGTGIKVANYNASSTFSADYLADYGVAPSSAYWRSDSGNGVGSWWQVDFDKPIDIRRIALSGYTSTNSAEAPSSFTVVYSDDELTWDVDSTFTGQTNWSSNELRSFELSGTAGAHKFWRIQINAMNGSTTAALVNVEMFDVNNRFNVAFYGDGPEMIARGPGRPDADNIYVSLRTDGAVVNGPNWIIAGSVGYASGLDAFSQPRHSGENFVDHPRIIMYDLPMKYWITASATGFYVFVRFQNITEGGWAKYLMANSIPTRYPYPLMISGSQNAGGSNGDRSFYHYTRTDTNHSLGFNPGVYEGSANSLDVLASPTRLYTPYNLWKQVANRKGTAYSGSSNSSLVATPYQSDDGASYAGPSTKQDDDQWPMTAVSILDRTTDDNYGDLDGLKHIAGIHQIESLITHEGDTWVILNNVHREQANEFFALRLS